MDFDTATDLDLTRVIGAPRAAVWRAWTEPDLLRQWFCPKPWRVGAASIDLRPGGLFLTEMLGPEGERVENAGLFLHVEHQRRLVFTDALGPGWRPSPRPFMTGVIEVDDAAGGGTAYRARALHADAETRRRHEEMGFHVGWGIAADQLEALARTL